MVLSRRRCAASVLSVCVLLMAPLVSSFQPSGRTVTIGSPLVPPSGRRSYQNIVDARDNSQPTAGSGTSTSLNMFMGSDGGLFGIGTPELATILIVGYFVLGPSDLYKLVKEIGKFIQNIRTLGNEATKTFENNMESQLELQELRKAQRELNDAFSFRRSINVDDQGEAFSTNAQSPRPQDDIGAVPGVAAAAAEATTAEASTLRKKKRRRVKKKAPVEEPINNNVPDLDVSDSMPTTTTATKMAEKKDWFADDGDNDEDAYDFDLPSASDMAREDLEWLKESKTTTTPFIEEKDPALTSAEQSRFQQQLSGNWNQKVLENEDKLGPMALVMQQLALLEEEKAAADKRLEEEFTARFKQAEEYYRKKRELLEETAAKVQKDAYITMDGSSKK